jgi:hypothetical protein
MNPQSPCAAANRPQLDNLRRPGLSLAAVITVVAAAALLAAACSDGASSTGANGTANHGTSASSASAVRYTNCMRARGVPDYPDPNAAGQLPKITPANEAQLGVSDSRFTSAQTACQRLWPYQGLTQPQLQAELTDALTFARCMRAHGVPGFPDPTTDPASTRVEFVISISQDGFDPQSPQTLAKVRQCEHGLPASMLPGSPTGVEVTTSP